LAATEQSARIDETAAFKPGPGTAFDDPKARGSPTHPATEALVTRRRTLLTTLLALTFLLLPTGASALVGHGTLSREVTLVGQTWHLDVMFESTCEGWRIDGYGVSYTSEPWTLYDFSLQSPTGFEGTWSSMSDSIEVVFVLEVERVGGGEPNQTGVYSIGYMTPPAECGGSACPATPRYFMYTLEDADQPDGWQPYCYIISSNGTPSVESQGRVCSVPGSGHTFRATNIPYAGWVYADCHGLASYGWPEWQPEWFGQ